MDKIEKIIKNKIYEYRRKYFELEDKRKESLFMCDFGGARLYLEKSNTQKEVLELLESILNEAKE